MGLPFEVDESVLIPRQDTESLVELALEKAKEKKRSLSVMDMCCGSGAIARIRRPLSPEGEGDRLRYQ